MSGPAAGVVARVSESGKLNVPSQLRKLVGLEKGGPVVIRFENGELHIRTFQAVLEELQAEAAALFAGSEDSVEQFLADRRAEATKEIEKDEQAESGKGEGEL